MCGQIRASVAKPQTAFDWRCHNRTLVATCSTTPKIPQPLEGNADEWLLAHRKDSTSPIDFSPMPDPYNHDYDPLPVDTVYHAIVSDSNPKMVRLRLELLAAWRKRIFAERCNFFGDPPLKLLVEVLELPDRGCREFAGIAHGN